MNVAITDILSGLEGLETEQSFSNKFEETFSNYGYNKYTYVGLDSEILKDPSTQHSLSDVIYLTNSDPNWVQRYVDQDYSSSDPIVHDCLDTLLPIRWTDNYRSNSRTNQETEMMSDAWEHGSMGTGVALPFLSMGRGAI